MTTVFLYEDVTATWAGGDNQSPPASSLLAEGRAMLDAVTADFQKFADVRLLDSWRRDFVSAGLTTEAEFRRHARSADFSLVIAPECGGRLELLAREVLQAGGNLLGPSPDAIHLTADKLSLVRHWEANGVRTPETWLPGNEPVDLPLVFKPRDGAGSQGVLLRPSLRSAERGEDEVVQEYVKGFAASLAFLIGPRTLTPLVPCAQHLSDDGRLRYQGGRLPIAPPLAERAIRIATAAVRCVPGLAGYVGVDVVLGDDGRDWAIEINPRLTTSYVGLRALAKFNLAEAMLAAIRGQSLPAMEWYEGTIAFTPDGRLSPLAA